MAPALPPTFQVSEDLGREGIEAHICLQVNDQSWDTGWSQVPRKQLQAESWGEPYTALCHYLTSRAFLLRNFKRARHPEKGKAEKATSAGAAPTSCPHWPPQVHQEQAQREGPALPKASPGRGSMTMLRPGCSPQKANGMSISVSLCHQHLHPPSQTMWTLVLRQR